jgi:hypothetical protein
MSMHSKRTAAQMDQELAFALVGAVLSTGALLTLSGAIGIACAVVGCAVCAYSLTHARRARQVRSASRRGIHVQRVRQ